MRLSFEGHNLLEIATQMRTFLLDAYHQSPSPANIKPVQKPVEKLVEKPVEKPVEKLARTFLDDMPPPVEKPKRARTAKQLENDERLRNVAKAKAKARETAKKVVPDHPMEMTTPPPPKTAEGIAPADLVTLRTQTIAELQSAYANGKDREVLELLSRFGNGAKTFRELTADAFVPIREAIDLGALT